VPMFVATKPLGIIVTLYMKNKHGR